MTVSLDRPTRPVFVVAPDPAVRWLAVLALALGGFGIGTTEFVAMGLLPDIASSFGITEPTAGHVISAYALGVVIGAPLIAALAARVRARRCFWCSWRCSRWATWPACSRRRTTL